MPKFDLPPEVDSYEPTWSPPKTPPKMGAGEARAAGNQRIENAAGSVPVVGPVLKGLTQFANVLASPDTKMGIFTGPVNGISKLGNAVGDLVQGKPIDVSDAWTISDQNARRLNPWRAGVGQYVGPSDQAGLEVGEGIGAELVGIGILGRLQNIRRLQQAAQALKKTQAVKSAAVAAKVNPTLRAGLNAGKNVGEALVSTTLAVPFLDAQDGNLANLGDAFGLKLPGRVEPGDNYLQALGKSLGVEGLAAPLALIGAGALIKPIREGMATGGLGWLDELADAELAPYMPQAPAGPALPPAAAADLVDNGSKSLPAFGQTGFDYGRLEAPAAQYDSAISRSLQEQTQIKQVEQQRQRLEGMGLVQRGEGGQLEFSLDAGVDPEIRLQVRQLQTQRGQLIKQATESGQDVGQELANIDQQIGDLIQSGRAQDAMDARPPVQPELDMPDGRPELDTYLANLDELSDAELRQIHSRVWREDADARMVQEQEAVQQQVAAAQQQIEQINARRDAGEITDTGAKRLLTKAEKALTDAELALRGIESRARVPESLVGDQLQLRIEQQGQLDLLPAVKLPPFKEITSTASEFGYRTADDYRNALTGWTRDQLRRLAMPESSPEVAALVKARTGRRVWQAKKQDIIDALVEISEQRGRYLPPEPEQLAMQLKANDFGGSAPLFDRPAELDVPGMGKVLDADGNEVVVPLEDYAPRGMDANTRERLKAQILQKAIANGEVQAPFSPLPNRPVTKFEQSSFIGELLADESGQLPLAYATDAMPTYKAGGKNVDSLVEEMRLRFEYQVLDAEAQRAQRQAYMAAHGWDKLTWEERKQLGVLGEGFYSLAPYSERFRDPTPAARSDLTPAQLDKMAAGAKATQEAKAATPPREPAVYALKFDNGNPVVVNEAAIPKPSREQAAAAKKAKRAEYNAERERAKRSNTVLDKETADLLKQRDQILRQQQGAKC